MDQIKPRRHRSYTGALILILLGVVFLLNNFGVLPWSVWDTLWRFWPALLIIWGLQLVLGAWWLGELIVGLITLVILVGVLGFSLAASNSQIDNYLRGHMRWWPNAESMTKVGDSETSSTTISQDDFPNITSRLFEADVNVGRLTVEDVDTTNHLILDSSFYGNFGAPELKTSTQDKDYGLTMKLKTQTNFNMWMGSMGHWGNLDYKATLGHLDIPTTLNLTASTGKIDVKLDSQKVQDFNLDLGTGSAVVELGEGALPPTFKAHAGTGSIQITLPKGVGLKIKHNLGTGSIKVDGQKLTGDGTDTFYSYDTATKKIDLDLELGTGSLTIITK